MCCRCGDTCVADARIFHKINMDRDNCLKMQGMNVASYIFSQVSELTKNCNSVDWNLPRAR